MMAPLYLIDEYSDLPPSHFALSDPEGLIAVSQTVSARLVWRAYHQGYYPCSPIGEELTLWWAPAERLVLIPHELHLSKNFKKRLKAIRREEQHAYAAIQVTVNQCFEEVIQACAAIPRQQDFDGGWISDEIIEAFSELHRHGMAHSFETWQDGELIGGLYGVSLGQIFCGESMFSKLSQASRIAFSHAVPFLAQQGIRLIDCQQDSEYLRSFGATLIPRADYEFYLQQLAYAAAPVHWPSGRISLDGQYIRAVSAGEDNDAVL
ncbi:leucyl/phenylalanyl-tRNA--protein transferase [Oligella urethralis]|uniref:leucyl/phenylalanyl-tRNA--protein transferase n=1 Tax=Oligella urethralis TaxID=90245 RepID=UPI001EFA15F7|nr:leucyl/phenylalanyl-tRNA--protein transferase [Oligella urethralis]